VDRPSPAVQDYLKAIYQLGETAPGEPVTTSQVAEALAVTTASASNMLKRLDGLGYVTQVKRQGVELTDSGRQAALEVIRHHRLLETYLATRLGMPWDEVHREAEVLEHHVSEALADRIAEELGHPERDPHGHPIPTSAGHMATTPSRRLSELGEGAEAVVARVDDRDDALLRFLAERGLRPDARVEVLAHAPFGGPISVRVDGERVVDVPPAAAAAVHVE
jgi:DtxR family Mn-dependent transcriptional regulator